MNATNASISSLRISNRTGIGMRLVIEPWATEYPLPPSATLDVVETGGSAEEAIEVQLEADRVILCARTSGIMSVFHDGVELVP